MDPKKLDESHRVFFFLDEVLHFFYNEIKPMKIGERNMMEEKVFEELTYLISYPKSFCEEKAYPLVVYLHGAGSRSDKTDTLRQNAPMQNLTKFQTKGYVLLAPLCSAKNWNEVMAGLIRLVDHVRGLPFIDEKRVHLTGNSMGGYGTWELASLRPEWFASAMPVCGGGIKWMTAGLVQMPIRAFHGICDTVVDPMESLEMAKAVNRRGGAVDLILFPTLAHNCWDAAYSNEANYDWMLAFTTDRDRALAENFAGKEFG